MTWFEAYILWNLDSLLGIFIPVVVVSCIGGIICTICYFFNVSETINSVEDSVWHRQALQWKAVCVRGLKISIPLAIISILLLAVTPSSKTLLKIIATKKGVDAMQSETAGKYLSEVDKAVTNGFKFLNQEIEKKLDKKESSK